MPNRQAQAAGRLAVCIVHIGALKNKCSRYEIRRCADRYKRWILCEKAGLIGYKQPVFEALLAVTQKLAQSGDMWVKLKWSVDGKA